jgi:hypothetical protein
VINSAESDAQTRGLLRLGYLQEYSPKEAAVTPKPESVAPVAPVVSKRKNNAKIEPGIPNQETKDIS